MACSSTDWVTVTLQLFPVGCQVYNMTLQRVLKLIECMLTTLVAIHEADFVHRDLRVDNIIETQSGFCLIDWELAGRNAEMVFWSGPSFPSEVSLRHRPYVFTDDLWQLGKTLTRIYYPLRFIERLCRCSRGWRLSNCFSSPFSLMGAVVLFVFALSSTACCM